MDMDRMDELGRDPRFISGIYNYCDAWCERCAFTSRCLNYVMAQEEKKACDTRTRDAENEDFWDKLHETFENTMEAGGEQDAEMDFEIGEEELQESMREQDEIREDAQAQPCSRIAMRYIEVVDNWFQAKEGLLDAKSDGAGAPARADTPGVGPAHAVDLQDCLEVIRWYHRQIWVKLCRAASGVMHAEIEDLECCQEDADGSAKVAIIGIERSIAAWGTLLRRFPDHEDAIHALGTLKRLLRQVEAAFPNARAFRRPGFDTSDGQTGV